MEGSSSVYKLERVSEVVSVRPALRTGVVAVGHAAALRYEGAGGAGAQLELQVLAEMKYFYCSTVLTDISGKYFTQSGSPQLLQPPPPSWSDWQNSA